MHFDSPTPAEVRPVVSLDAGIELENSFSITPTPSWTMEREILWKTANQPGEHALFLLSDTQYSHALRTSYERVVRRINTPEAVQKLSHLDINYDPKTTHLSVHEVRVWREGHCQSFADRRRFIFRQREGSLESQILNGHVSAIVILDDVRPGDTLEFSYSFITTHELAGRKIEYAFLRERNLRTMAWFVSLYLPKDQFPEYQQSDGERQEPEVYDSGEEYIWVWSGRQEENHQEEEGVPFWEPTLAWSQVSSYGSWGEVAGLLFANWAVLSSYVHETEAWVSGMESEGRSLESRVSGAIQWVQDRIRYQGLEMGLGGVLPSPPDDVLRRRYGDCKDKSLLLCAVLRALGVEACPLLVNTTFRENIKNHLPGLSSFNHAIVTFVVNGRRGFADPTALGAGGDAFGQCLPDYGAGLCIGAEIEDLLPIPHVAKGLSAWLIEEEFFLAPQGSKSQMIQKVEATGFEADMMRARLAQARREGYAKDEARDLQRFFPDIQPMGGVGVTDDRDNNHILVETRFQFTDWGQDIDGNFRMFAYNGRWMTQFLSSPASHPPRKRNFMLRFPLNIRHEVVIHGALTPGSEEDYFVDCQWFHSRTHMEWEGKDTVRLTYTYQNRERLVNAMQVPEYLKKFSQMAQMVGCQIRVKKRGFRRKEISERPLAGASEGEEAGFEPRLSGDAVADTSAWFEATRRQKLKRKVKGWGGPVPKGRLIYLGLVVGIVSVAGMMRDHSSKVPPKIGLQKPPVTEAYPKNPPEPAGVARDASSSPAQTPNPGRFQDLTDPALARAEAAVRRGDIPGATPDLDYLQKKYPDHPQVLMILGMAETLQGKWGEARNHADRALKIAPGHPLAISLLARLDLTEKKLEDAEKRFLYLTQFFPGTPDGWSGLSFVYTLQLRFEDSEKAARQSLRINPVDPDMLKQMLYLAMRRNAPDEAKELILAALKKEPASGWLHGLYAILLCDSGNYPQALEQVEEAQKLQPGVAVLVVLKARIFAQTGRKDEAYELAKAAMVAAPFDQSVNEFAGRAFSDCQKYPEAVDAFTKCVERTPEDFNARNALGFVLILSGDLPGARRELEKSVSLNPGYLVAWENLLNACRQAQDWERASQCEAKIAQLKSSL